MIVRPSERWKILTGSEGVDQGYNPVHSFPSLGHVKVGLGTSQKEL